MPLRPALLAVLLAIAVNGALADSALAISKEDALGIALENARVPRVDAHNIRIQADEEGEEPVWSVEFDTHYGDYDFSVSRGNGRILDADYEVDDEWVQSKPSRHVTSSTVREIVQGRVPGARASDIRVVREDESFEGHLFHHDIKYEFEVDARTGIITDWNADLRR